MKAIIILALVFIGLLTGCNSSVNNSQTTYELVNLGSGILVEKFDSLNKDENKYNYNNEVFKEGTKFTYDFQHFTTDNELQFFRINDDNKTWDFASEDETEGFIVKEVLIGTLTGNPMAKYVPDYNQTSVSYKFKEDSPYSMSGVIENEANLWMHPPRDYYFKILELNPFPYIKAPYEIGTKWTWKLGIGSQWGDERWKTWEGNIQNNYQYEITDKKTLSTNFGDLECFVIESTAESRLGNTALTAYYHPKYGFVQLHYTNIDGSKTHLKLTKHSK